jgi:hypothetical protein
MLLLLIPLLIDHKILSFISLLISTAINACSIKTKRIHPIKTTSALPPQTAINTENSLIRLDPRDLKQKLSLTGLLSQILKCGVHSRPFFVFDLVEIET